MDLVKMSYAEFRKVAKIVYDRTGIHLPDSKLSLLSNRLRKRLRALEINAFEDYYKLLCDPRRMEDELPHFLSAVTTNETYFFRNESLWKYFRESWLPQTIEKKKARGLKSIRIWSAASSSGEEAYTTAICLCETIPDISMWRINVIGSDISQKVLERARSAEYNDYAVSKLSREKVAQWFETVGDLHRVKPKPRGLVSFQFHNLRDKFSGGQFDLVFLRNVLMYFDLEMKKRVLANVINALVPGGQLVVGDVDPLRNTPGLSGTLNLSYIAPNVYQKPEASVLTSAGACEKGGAR